MRKKDQKLNRENLYRKTSDDYMFDDDEVEITEYKKTKFEDSCINLGKNVLFCRQGDCKLFIKDLKKNSDKQNRYGLAKNTSQKQFKLEILRKNHYLFLCYKFTRHNLHPQQLKKCQIQYKTDVTFIFRFEQKTIKKKKQKKIYKQSENCHKAFFIHKNFNYLKFYEILKLIAKYKLYISVNN